MLTSTLQEEDHPITESTTEENYSDMLFTVVGLFLIMILIWLTIKGKLRDWFMK